MRPILITAAVALVLAGGALGKGASEATIEGPALDGRVVIPGNGEDGGGTTLGSLAQLAGFFPSVFGQTPDATQDTSPATSLGPRYVVRYTMPVPNGRSSVITQDVYPYAKPQPVTYMKPRQRVWPGQTTVGGWYVTTTELTSVLETVGLPSGPPTADDSSSRPGALLIEIGTGVLLATAAIVTAVAVRRRRRATQVATT